MPTTEVLRWQRTLARVQAATQRADARLAELRDERRRLLLEEVHGTAGVRAALDDNAQRLREAEGVRSDLDVQLAEIERQLASAEEAEREAQREERLATARALAAQRLEMAAHIDRAIGDLVTAFDRLWTLGTQIAEHRDLPEVARIRATLTDLWPLGDAIAARDRQFSARVLNWRCTRTEPLSLSDHERGLLAALVSPVPSDLPAVPTSTGAPANV